MLDRIWSSTQRLEDLNWFGPNVPYVQYGGGVLALLLSSQGAQSSEGSLQTVSSSVEPLSVQPFPTWGAFPYIVQGGAPIYIYLALCLGTVGVRFVIVSRRGPLGRSGVGGLDPGDLLGQWVILAIFLGNELSRCCPILTQSGRPDHSDGRLGVTSGLVRLGLCSLSAGLPYVSLA